MKGATISEPCCRHPKSLVKSKERCACLGGVASTKYNDLHPWRFMEKTRMIKSMSKSIRMFNNADRIPAAR